jgi:hypothetical protein
MKRLEVEVKVERPKMHGMNIEVMEAKISSLIDLFRHLHIVVD